MSLISNWRCQLNTKCNFVGRILIQPLAVRQAALVFVPILFKFLNFVSKNMKLMYCTRSCFAMVYIVGEADLLAIFQVHQGIHI